MSVIMGGSGSTGSSLVKNILNRHKDIFAGEETSFFAKQMIYENWTKARKRIVKRKLNGLRNHGYHIYNGTDMVHPEYGYTKDEVAKLAIDSDTLDEFCESFYNLALVKNNARFWIEKTPANSACFQMFLDHFDHGKVIHIVRNPYDTIASLWNRGYDLHYAVGIYLINTACGLTARKNRGRYHEVKYEDLVQMPNTAISDLCKFLKIMFVPDILESQGENIEVSQLPGWNYDETANIGTKALGRFDRLSEAEKLKLIEAVELIRISDAGKELYNVKFSNIKEICNVLGYEYQNVSELSSLLELRKMLKKDRLQRLKRGYTTVIKYPLDLLREY